MSFSQDASPDEIAELQSILRRSPLIVRVFDRWPDLRLPDCWLVAGAVAQTVWNARHGFAPEHGIKDIDIVYFDPSDLAASTEQAIEARVSTLMDIRGTKLDVKNEARVHLWYEEVFGKRIRPYASSADAIASFPTAATSVGVRPAKDGIEVEAPFGLRELLDLLVKPNKRLVTEAVYRAKAERWRREWPNLDIRSWNYTYKLRY